MNRNVQKYRYRLLSLAFASGVFLTGFSVQAVLVAPAKYANEWTFETDTAGGSLSEASNSGTNSPLAQFDAGFDSKVFTTNRALLCLGEDAGANGVWTNGAILDATLPSAASGVHYLRYDVQYDLSATNNNSGTVLGVYFTGESETKAAGLVMGYYAGNLDNAAPANRKLTAVSEALPLAGTLTAIAEVHPGSGAISVWYDMSGSNLFNYASPAFSTNITLTSIDNLRFHATGDFRPGGSTDYATVDNIRQAETWIEIIDPVVDFTAPPSLNISVSDSANGVMESGDTNRVTVIISNSGGPASDVTSFLTNNAAPGAFTVTSSNAAQTLWPNGSMTNTYEVIANTNTIGSYLFTLQALVSGTNNAATNFTIVVGSKISYQSNNVTEISGGVIAGKYEPAETIDIEVFNLNNGAQLVSNIVTSIFADPDYFSISNLTSVTYASMAVGDVTSTVYRVEISSDTPHGSYLFSVTNQTGSRVWVDSFLFEVFSRADPILSTNSVVLVADEGDSAQQQVVVSNAGNEDLFFTITDDAAWDNSLTVDTSVTPSTKLSGGTAIPLNDPEPDNPWLNATDSGESDTINIGFDFPFYGTTYSKLYIDSNGAIIFSTNNLIGNRSLADISVGDLPLGNRPMIAPFRDKQLEISDGSPVRYSLKSNPTRLVIVHTGVTLSAYPSDGTDLQFQTELFADGKIKFSYYNINGSELDLVAVGIQNGAGSFMNVDLIPASGSAVLINSAEDSWVRYTPAGGTVLPGESISINFIADATSQTVGTVNAFTTTFNWVGIGSDDVAVDAEVVAAVPVLETPDSVLFEGNAGQITTAILGLTNSGSGPLNFTITDTGSASASYQGAVSNGFIWTDISDEAALTMIDPDENPHINADNEGFSALQPIGFEFPFYGGIYTHFSAGVNGGISLGATGRMWASGDLSSNEDNVPQQFIAPYWGNLVLDANAAIRFQSTADQLVVTWENMEQSGVTPGTDLTFQTVLHADGRIEFRYQQINGSFWPLTPWGIRSGTARSNSGKLILPGDEIITIDDYGYPKTNYVNVISNRVVSMTSSNYPIITYTPSQGAIAAGETVTVELRGNAVGMTPGGPNSVTNEATLNIAYEAGSNPVNVTFVVTNSVENALASPLAAADVDGDGMTYDDELIAGTDPLRADSVFTVTTEAGHVISWPIAVGRTYTVWYTLSLKDDFVPLPGAAGLTIDTFTDVLHKDVAVIFYKVTVE